MLAVAAKPNAEAVVGEARWSAGRVGRRSSESYRCLAAQTLLLQLIPAEDVKGGGVRVNAKRWRHVKTCLDTWTPTDCAWHQSVPPAESEM